MRRLISSLSQEQQEPTESLVLSSYEEARINDSDVQKFDERLRTRTDRVLNSLRRDADEQKFSFDSLKETTTTLVDLDIDVMEVILEFRDDVWKRKELFMLVEEFFDNSLATLEFCTATESSINSAKENQSVLQAALDLIPKDRDPDEHEIKTILTALQHFCSVENPFGETFIGKFTAVYERHKSMLKKLKEEKDKLDRKLKHVAVWAKVSSILFGAVAAAVLICSIVAAAIAAPPVAAALAAAAALPIGSVGAWFKSVWSRYEDEYRAQRSVIEGMALRTHVALKDLETMRSLASSLESQLKSMASDVEFLDEHRDVTALRLVADGISTKRSSFVKELDELQKYVDNVGKRIRNSRNIVLQAINERLNKPPSCVIS